VHIKVLGSGCKSCDMLTERMRQAAAEAGVDATVEKVTDLAEFERYGIMSTPALVIDDEVIMAGRVPKPKDLVKMLERRG